MGTTPDEAVVPPNHDEAKYYHKVLRNMDLARSLAIFRRYDDINLLSIMSLQAEITTLNEMLKRRRKIDSQDAEVHHFDRSFKALRDFRIPIKVDDGILCDSCHKRQDPNFSHMDTSQYGLMERLRAKMAEYNALILQVSQLSKLPSPPKSQLQSLKDLLKFEAKRLPPETPYTFPPSTEFVTWDERDPDKYYSLDHEDSETDPLTRAIKEYIVPLFHWVLGKRIFKKKIIDAEAQLSFYEDEKLVKASSIIAVMISSALPVITIFVLNKVKTTNIRIAWTVGFTMIFAMILVLFSSAKRVEIFAATATFAAVEVVFIGSALGNSST
ncbi:hypothetical protein QBC38DRAFT_484584 [Podospora fimiseda]|uniref:DUF6594 domain-containing protein n=1 Tax=Podospora fimiseda TaxID=252190 RepID=A0AAN7BK45_9PEZI|nr:hypothetical protein QBC38DRAFT_484584 [Podospora fimiseda]